MIKANWRRRAFSGLIRAGDCSGYLPGGATGADGGGSLCLLLTTNEFGIVLFIGAKGVNTLPMMVYSKAILESDYSVACMIALINILLSLGLFMLYRLAAARTGVRS